MHPPKAENGGGGSSTTNRRYSVSVVQPRRPTVVGFNAPEHNAQDESAPSVFHTSTYGRGGLRLSDDDLADDFGALSLSKDGPGPLLLCIPLASHPGFLFTRPCLGARSRRIVYPPISPSTSTSPAAHHLRLGSVSALPVIAVCPLVPVRLAASSSSS